MLPVVDKNLLHNLLSVQSKSRDTVAMTKFIARFAKKQGATVVLDKGNLYVTKGKADQYPCVVAHTDTVHAMLPNDEYAVYSMPRRDDTSDTIYFAYNPKKQKLVGVGGDDKVGIFLALSALRDFDTVKCAFFRDEEIGCVGSRLADMDFFKDVTLVMQGDRRGNDDFVYNIMGDRLQSNEFMNAVDPILEKYGYHFEQGAMTDVHELKTNGLGVACANFSCGYYDPHSPNEYISFNDLQNTMGMMYTVIIDLGGKAWPHEYVPYTYSYTRYSQNNVTTIYPYGDEDEDDWRNNNAYYDKWRSNTKKTTNVTSEWEQKYRTVVGDDGPLSEDLGYVTHLSVDDDNNCPLCTFNDLVEYDDNFGMYFCERCVTYLAAQS